MPCYQRQEGDTKEYVSLGYCNENLTSFLLNKQQFVIFVVQKELFGASKSIWKKQC